MNSILNQSAQTLLEAIRNPDGITKIDPSQIWIIKELDIPTAKTLWDLEMTLRTSPQPPAIFFQNLEELSPEALLEHFPERPELFIIPDLP